MPEPRRPRDPGEPQAASGFYHGKGNVMNYAEWIRNHLEEMARSLGFVFTPLEEISLRLERLRREMLRENLEAVLVVQKIDLFYFSGTAQDAILLVPVHGAPLLAVRREVERSRVESPLDRIVEMVSLRELPSMIQEHLGYLPGSLGIELDVLPVRDFRYYTSIFQGCEIRDASGIIKKVRRRKSPFEVRLMKEAGEIARKTYHEALGILGEGMTEIEFGGWLEATAKKYGHEGLLRVRSMNYEAYTWHILSGPSGGIVSQSDSPMGGFGVSPIFPVGASRRRMKAREPILVDFGTCFHGYLSDQTRMFSIGRMPRKFVDAYRACREIHDAVLAETRPGMDCARLFELALGLAAKMGYADTFLGPRGLQSRFIGHGIGLELSEPPFLAEKHDYPLEEGMTFALEPKIVFPGEGAVGIENTVLVTDSGYEILTPLEEDIFQV